MWLQRRADNQAQPQGLSTITLETTGKWDGHDGKWSTFFINVGDYNDDQGLNGYGQNFRVLVSNSLAVTQVPQRVTWCDDDDGDCAERRGLEIFHDRIPSGLNVTNDSEHPERWVDVGMHPLPLPDWWSKNMGFQVNASSGLSPVGLGRSTKFPNAYLYGEQRVMATTNEDLFMGTLGLENTPVDAGGNAPIPLMQTLADLNVTSESYSYTAGAYYRRLAILFCDHGA